MVTGGNKVTIKTPLIATRYSFIISGLRCEVADVALIWRKKISFKEFGFESKQMESCTSLHKFIRFIEVTDTTSLGDGYDFAGLKIRLHWVEDTTSLGGRYDFTGWKSQFRWLNEVAALAE